MKVAKALAPDPGRRYRTPPAGPAPAPTSDAVTRSMRGNRSSGTIPELTLSRLLHKTPGGSRLPGRPDFVYPRARLAVFVHGDFWHRNPALGLPLPKTHSSYWRKKFARNVERDRLVKEELEAMGWKVLVVWESEVKGDPLAAAEKIRLYARSSPIAKNNNFLHDSGGDGK